MTANDDRDGEILFELIAQIFMAIARQTRNILTPRHILVPRDPRIDVWTMRRAIVAIMLAGMISVAFRRPEDLAMSIIFAPFEMVFNLSYSIPVALLVIAGFIAASKPQHRAATARHMLVPLRSLGAVAIAFGLAAIVVHSWDSIQTLKGSILGLALMIVLIVAAPVTITVLLTAAFIIPKYWFRAADGHPLLAPVIAIGVVCTAAFSALADGDRHMPMAVELVVHAGAVASVTALAVFEIRRTKKIYGVTFRNGPFVNSAIAQQD